MGTISSCLKKIGLSKHEAAILRGSTDDNIKDGDPAHVAAVRAVSDYLEALEKERSSIAEQVIASGGKVPDAPFKLSDLADLTAVLRASSSVAEEASAKAAETPPSEKDVAPVDGKKEQKEEAPGPFASQQIEDFGEKLEGARKDRAPSLSKEISDDEIATQPLSKIWPAAEIDDIENKFAAAVAYAARNEIPSKPRVSYKVARWVEKVKALRGIAKQIIGTGEEYARTVMAGMVGLSDFRAKVALLEAIDRNQWNRIGTVSEHPSAYRYDESGNKVPAPSVRVEVDGKNQYFEGAQSVADVVEKINGLLGVEQQAKKMQFEVRTRRSNGEVFINKKGDSEHRPLKTFATSKEAFEFIKSNYDDLVAAWEGVKEQDNVTKADVRNATNRQRTGSDWRGGKDVTPDQFESTFGFRGVQFGNWVRQGGNAKDRQGMLNQAYDALMDLADIVGVPPKALSLNGTMGLAFGARGSGSASAHFEPDQLVINLTKTKGAGSLAHEWFHSLDNYFSRMRTGEVKIKRGLNAQQAYRANNFITYRPEPMMVQKGGRNVSALTKAELDRRHAQNPNSGFYDPKNWEADPNHPEGVRPEVERAWAELVEALDASPMKSRSAMNDKGTDGYWSRIIERGARAFENYVIAKMMEKGYNNDYLANVRDVQDFPRAKERYPYLLPEEVAPIAEAFDNLFSTVETKETDQGIAIFNAEEGAAIPEDQWMSLGKIHDTIKPLLDNFKTVIPVKVIDRANDHPAISTEPNVVVSGFVKDGIIHLVREGIADEGALVRTLFHELLHFGLRRFLKRDQYIEVMKKLYYSDPVIRDATEAWINSKQGQSLRKEIADDSYYIARCVDEVLADLVEEEKTVRIKDIVVYNDNKAGLWNNIRNWLAWLARKFGFDAMADVIETKPTEEKRTEYYENRYAIGDDARNLIIDIFGGLESNRSASNGGEKDRAWAYSDPAFSKAYNDKSLTGENDGNYGKGNNDVAGRTGQRTEFWQRLGRGDSFTGDEFVQALVAGRGDAWQGKLVTGVLKGGRGSIAWNNEVAGFSGHVTHAFFDRSNNFNVVVIPAEFVPDEGLSPEAISDISISTYTISEASDGALEFGVSEPSNGTIAFAELQRKGKIKPTGKFTADGKHEYHKVDLGYGVAAKMIQETIRRYAIAQGGIGNVRFVRETGSKAGKGIQQTYQSAYIKEHFSLSGNRTANTNAQTRSALTDRFGDRGIRALEKAGMLKITTVANAPESIRAAAERENASALYLNGVAYIFSDRISADQAPAKLLHELGEHYGIESMLGKDGWKRMMKRVSTMAKARGSIAKAAWDGVKEKYREFDGLSDEQLAVNDRFIHEVVAKIGENEQGQKTSLWRELLAKFKDWLSSLGVMTDWMNEGDIVNLVNGSLKKVMKDAEAGLVEDGTIGELVTNYFKQIVAAMESDNQLVKDCA